MKIPVRPYKILTLFFLLTGFEIVFWLLFFSVWFYMERNVENFVIENSNVFKLFFLLVPLYLTYFFHLNWKNKAYKKLATANMLPRLIQAGSSAKSFLSVFFFRNALVFIIIALANPQFGEGKREAKSEGIEIMVALDISKSMLAKDLDPRRDRLNIAVLALEKLLEQLHGDKIGVVVFAGDAYVYVPMTSDYRAVKMYLRNLSTDLIGHQGTNIGWAIDHCMNSFDFTNDMKKTILLISDGEDHDIRATEATKRAAEEGVIINTVGIGTATGAPIPEYKNGKKIGMKKDKDGNTILSKLNEDMLRNIANTGSGVYASAKGTQVPLGPIIERVGQIEKTEFEITKYDSYEDQFFAFLTIGWLFFVLYLITSEKKSVLLAKWNV